MAEWTPNQLAAGRQAHGVFHRSAPNGTRPTEPEIRQKWDKLSDNERAAWIRVAKSCWVRAANYIQAHLMDDISLTVDA